MTLVVCAIAAALTFQSLNPPRAVPTTLEATKNNAPAILQQVVVIGASASSGFRLQEKDGRAINLGHVLDAGIKVPHQPVKCFASEYFFVNPQQAAKVNVESALAEEPSLVVALDFLFWFVYGLAPSVEKRLERLEEGFEFLEQFDCPIVISLVPDMSAAVGIMLHKAQMPTLETLQLANDRILDWAEMDEQIVLAPLVEVVTKINANQSFAIHGSVWDPKQHPRLIQYDHLHPTLEGLGYLGQMTWHTALAAELGIPESAIRWQPLEITKGLQPQEKFGLKPVR